MPDRMHEVQPGSGDYVGDQDMYANCINPIFATNLPTDATNPANLCSLTRGPRTPDLVYYAAIAGVPHELLQAAPGSADCAAGVAQADCPQKSQLTEDDWLKITGKGPENFDFTGADFHMLESEDPRTGSLCSPNSMDTCDPINGREWATAKGDLQFSCIFKFAAPKDCTQPQYQGACDGKAYPSVREMEIAHAMADQTSGIQGIASSLCPIHTMATSATDQVFGYRPAVNAIIDRLKNALSVQCLPQKLTVDATTGSVPCLILVTLAPGKGTDCSGPGLSNPPADVLARFQAAQHEAYVAACGGKTSCVATDPSTLTTCQMNELTQQQNPQSFQNGDCSGSAQPGWCYVEGAAAGTCSQQILFTGSEPPPGATVTLQCLELAATTGP